MNWSNVVGTICCGVIFWYTLDRYNDIAEAAKRDAPTRTIITLTGIAVLWTAILLFVYYAYFIFAK